MSEAAAGPGYKNCRLGTHRAVSPAETLSRVAPLMHRMGITRVANVTGLDRIGVPVVMVVRPNSRSLAVSQGKGLDLAAAKASGLMESAENYHAERIDLPLKLGSYEDLRDSHRLADVDGLPEIVGSRFHPHRRLLWIEGRDIGDDAPVWLPFEMVHADYTLPLPAGSGCFLASTNGLASGNILSEAIAHGIAEVVERDSTTVWNHLPKARRDATRIALETIDDAASREVVHKLEDAGMTVAVWDVTTDVGIAAFYCLITDNRFETAHSGAGAGCHPARNIALMRALTEAIQVRTTYITGSRDDLSGDEYAGPGIMRKLRRARALMQAEPMRDYHAVPNQEHETFEDDISWMCERLRAVGVEQVAAVDLTSAELGLPVARVVIPWLEGPDDHENFVPGPRARAAEQHVP